MHRSFHRGRDAASIHRANEKSAIISTSDPCVHAASLRGWSQDYLQLSAGRFSGKIVEVSIGPIQVFKEMIHQRVDEKANPRRDSYTVGVPVYVGEDGYWQGYNLQRDSLMTLCPNEELHFRTPLVSSILVTVINCAEFDFFSNNTGDVDVGSLVAWAKTGEFSSQAAERFRATLQQVLVSVISTPEVLEHTASQRAIIDTVMNASMDALLARVEENKPSRKAHAVQRTIVERARNYVLANRENPLTVSDLCFHLRMSRRGLHHAFMNVLGVNTITFLRYVKLHGVKKDLLQANPTDSVTGIACKWGFWHMGMFSLYYKNLFGETPSMTLRKLTQQSTNDYNLAGQ